MTKTLLQQIMVKKDEKLDTMHQSDLIKKIQSGYVAERGPKHTQKKTFAPSTIAYGHGECPRYWYLAFDGQTFEDHADPYGAANMTAGSLSHGRIQTAMRDSGILIEDEFKIINEDPPIFGYGDVMLDYKGERLVGEIKTVRNDDFEHKKLSRKPKMGHLMQLLMYMKVWKIRKGVMIYENKNNHELLTLPVIVNDQYRTWVDETFEWMRVVYKSWQDKQLPEIPYRSNSRICKSCPIQKACAEAGDGTIKIKPMKLLKDEKDE
jgi:CRISPR/Cas system-associated exonuclease Cas4 (RecB family)